MAATALYRSSSLQSYRRSIYSQNGEDGVIAELLRRLDIETGWFCEFGAWDGRYGSNCYALLRRGWFGVMIEGEPSRFGVLQRLAERYSGRLHAIEAFVAHESDSRQTLDRLLARTPIPKDFELLSIDIDGLDYQVWRTVAAYRPIIVIIEIDSSIPPGTEQVHGNGRNTSFSAMLKLGLDKGYRLVAHTGNLVFVRADQVHKLGLPAAELSDPQRLFVSEWIDPSRFQVFRRKLRYLTARRLIVKLQNSLEELEGPGNRLAVQALRIGWRWMGAALQRLVLKLRNALQT